MHDYELMYIIRPDGNEEALNATVARVRGFITDRGGEFTKETAWGRRRLAYPIQDFREGVYQIVEFRFDAAQVAPLDRAIRLTEEVIRHQILRPEKKANGSMPEPPISAVRDRRGGADGRGAEGRDAGPFGSRSAEGRDAVPSGGRRAEGQDAGPGR